MAEPIASLVNLRKVYGTPDSDVSVEALRGVSMDIHRGDTVAIIGQSGSGKSTMMNIIGCLDRPTSGQYLIGGTDVATLSDDQLSDIRGRSIGFVFQNFNLIAQMTLLENLEVPLFYLGKPRAERRELAIAHAELVGLKDRMSHTPSEMSGGQQQRAAIARALVNDPLIILADEPTGNLDTATTQEILEVFDDLHDRGKTVVIVTHEDEVADRCARVVTLRDGEIVEDVRNRPRAEAAESSVQPPA